MHVPQRAAPRGRGVVSVRVPRGPRHAGVHGIASTCDIKVIFIEYNGTGATGDALPTMVVVDNIPAALADRGTPDVRVAQVTRPPVFGDHGVALVPATGAGKKHAGRIAPVSEGLLTGQLLALFTQRVHLQFLPVIIQFFDSVCVQVLLIRIMQAMCPEVGHILSTFWVD